jgi:hypothetical protein
VLFTRGPRWIQQELLDQPRSLDLGRIIGFTGAYDWNLSSWMLADDQESYALLKLKLNAWHVRVGPTIGSLLAVIIYVFMKRFEYWRSNIGQDTDVFSASPELFIARPVAEGSTTRPRFLSMSKSGERIWFPTTTAKNRSPSEALSVEARQVSQVWAVLWKFEPTGFLSLMSESIRVYSIILLMRPARLRRFQD